MAMDDDKGDETDPELARALVYVHQKLGVGLLQHQELSAHVYALTETLIAAGLIERDEVERRKDSARELMVESAKAHWEGVEFLTEETDKYEVSGPEIACAERIQLCRGACCRLEVHLSRQDLAEGVVRWDVGRPYTLRHREDGSCHHQDPTTKSCGVHGQRPLVCRQYDCRSDPRIWIDFEARVPNPKLEQLP